MVMTLVINIDEDSFSVVEVKLSVDVVPSGGRHRQISVLVLRTAFKMTQINCKNRGRRSC